MSMNRDTRSTGSTSSSTMNTGRAPGTSTLVGVFDDRRRAQEAVAELERLGFSADQVGYAARDGDTEVRDTEVTTDTGSGSGALTGAATGGVLGGIVGAAAALLIPGVGPVVAAGILGPLLGAAAAGAGIGAVGGGLIGGLTTTGVAEEDARYYDEQFRAGRSLVVVNAAGREAEARRVLEQFGAYDVDRRQAADYDRSGRTATAQTGEQLRGEGTVRIPEVEERLDVEKRERQAGEVRIDKRVEEERKTIPVELEREEVHVERRDVERPLTDADKAAFEEGTIRVPVRAEEAVVRKEAVVTGEVVVDKERHTEREQVSDTVRRTHVEVNKDLDRSRTGSATTAAAWSDAMPRYRTHWQERYASKGGRWEEFEPAYRYGYEMRSDPRFRGRRYAEVEPELRAEWGRLHPGSAWDRFKANVREAWEDVKD